ncbi:MAG TPA: hypothetical protein VL907_14980 [Pyrinomonadaceae bacterium]|jgi:uncharacterized membrane protein|nr:hypothetical protein [Pyrinomonadaceae bacterium]
MFQKLFQITAMIFFVLVSVVMVGLVLSVVISLLRTEMIAETGGISFAVGGITNRQFVAIIVSASLIVAGCFLFFRRKRFRR